MNASTPIEVLLIEDNAGDARLVEHVLSEYRDPVTLRVAVNGEQALQMLSGAGPKPDLIVLDLSAMAGDELSRRWAAVDIPRVVFSSSANPREIGRMLANGASDYVQKPTDLDTFARAMYRILDKWAPKGTNGTLGGAILPPV